MPYFCLPPFSGDPAVEVEAVRCTKKLLFTEVGLQGTIYNIFACRKGVRQGFVCHTHEHRLIER